MKYRLLILLFIFIGHTTYSQNLIRNGSFETPSVDYSAIGFYSILSNCFTTAGATPPDSWTINTPDPDRMKNGTIYCLYDNDVAQDGSYYAVLNNTEDIEVTLTTPLIKDCLYQFSCWLNLETLDGTQNNPSRVMFFRNSENHLKPLHFFSNVPRGFVLQKKFGKRRIKF